jgi:hypothetical protein
VLLDQCHHAVDVVAEIPGDGDLRVPRGVVGVEERRGVVQRRLLELGEVAVAVVGVGERVVEDRGQQDPGEAAVGPVQDVEPDLLLDDVDLVAQVLDRQLRCPQPVRLQEQGPLERGGGQHLEVVGVVLVRRAVEHPARALDVPEVRELLQALAALEHEVLEQVRETGAALGLGAEPDVDVDGDPDDRGVRVRREEHAKPVGEGGAVEVGHGSDPNRTHRQPAGRAGQSGGNTTNWRNDRSG